jgi:GcrA cell cycle regulator
MTNYRGQWAEAHLAILKAGWPDPTVAIRHISDAVDRGPEPVIAMAKKLDLGKKAVANPSGWTDEKVEVLKVLWAEGVPASEIGARLGRLTRNAVIGKAHRLGLSLRRPEVSKTNARIKNPQRAKPRPALKVNAGNQVFMEPEPRPIRTLPKAHAFEPLPGTAPQRYEDRPTHGCKWPVGEGEDIRACCEPSVRSGYCAPHAELCFAAPRAGSPRTANELARSLRRYVSR